MSFQERNFPGLGAGKILLVLSFALLSSAFAAVPDTVEQYTKPNDLLRQAVSNEKLRSQGEYYAWTDRLQKPRGSVTKLMVTTPHGILARTIAINNRALTDSERRQDEDRNNRLLDPQKMRDKANKQREDQQHIERLLVALPDAFHCEYDPAGHEDRNLRMNCAPNPNFSPPNYESQVLQGMKAIISIDREEKRISRIEGTLFRDVSFGWGIIGKLNRGGHIEITQSKVAGKHWGLTRMQLVFDGRIIMVKPLHIEEVETLSDYHSVPKMTVEEALDFMRSSPVQASR